MHEARLSRVRVWTRSAALLAGWLALSSGAVVAAESTAKPKPPRLPTIELPPPPPEAQGTPQAREARKRMSNDDYAGALPLYREAWAKGLRRENSTYNAACAAAVTGHPEEAFVWLARTADVGWRDIEHLKGDPDLDTLREDPRFAEFVSRIEANAARYERENNAELGALYEADQGARRDTPDMHTTSEEERRAFWERVTAEDAERRARVAEIVAAGEAKSGADYFAAAMVYQHGDRLEALARRGGLGPTRGPYPIQRPLDLARGVRFEALDQLTSRGVERAVVHLSPPSTHTPDRPR